MVNIVTSHMLDINMLALMLKVKEGSQSPQRKPCQTGRETYNQSSQQLHHCAACPPKIHLPASQTNTEFTYIYYSCVTKQLLNTGTPL